MSRASCRSGDPAATCACTSWTSCRGPFRRGSPASCSSPERALARGYVGDPELTAQKFVSAPWDPNQRLYASGDVVRLGWDGTIEFRNRADRQVKIRGLRVEPAEIDRVLIEHPGVREAVSVVQYTERDGNVLVGLLRT